MDSTEHNTKTAPSLPLQACAASIPLLAVLIGLYIFSSAWLATLIYYAGVAAYITATRQAKVLQNLTRGFNTRLILLTAPAFALAGPAIYFLVPPAVRPDTTLPQFLASVGLASWRYPLFALAFCLLNPTLEEAFWRGTFRTNPRKPSWTDLAFAAYHVPVALKIVNIPLASLSFIMLVLTAWSLRILTHKTNGLATPYLVHLTADISILTAAWHLTTP